MARAARGGGVGRAGVLGCSLGEGSALAGSGMRSEEATFAFGKQRSRLRAEAAAAHPGAMSALLKADEASVEALCADNAQGEVLVPANFNCPGQIVIAGTPAAVERAEGDDVFAGTAVEDGQIVVQVRAKAAETKLRSIVSLVERSGANKAQAQSRMERLADGIVAWNFLLAAGVALVTGSLTKASAALMVDYSCALKLTSSIAVLSAMSHSANAGFAVKGSKHFEAMAAADVIVFDKTGTLTEATPAVACVLALDGWNRREVLRLSACLEEHFPHPVARAVVRAAAQKNLKHRERHAEVEYIVAHGIASSLGGKRVVIGSEHFVMGDAGVAV